MERQIDELLGMERSRTPTVSGSESDEERDNEQNNEYERNRIAQQIVHQIINPSSDESENSAYDRLIIDTEYSPVSSPESPQQTSRDLVPFAVQPPTVLAWETPLCYFPMPTVPPISDQQFFEFVSHLPLHTRPTIPFQYPENLYEQDQQPPLPLEWHPLNSSDGPALPIIAHPIIEILSNLPGSSTAQPTGPLMSERCPESPHVPTLDYDLYTETVPAPDPSPHRLSSSETGQDTIIYTENIQEVFETSPDIVTLLNESSPTHTSLGNIHLPNVSLESSGEVFTAGGSGTNNASRKRTANTEDISFARKLRLDKQLKVIYDSLSSDRQPLLQQIYELPFILTDVFAGKANIVRPCYSKVLSDELTREIWREHTTLSELYVNRTIRESKTDMILTVPEPELSGDTSSDKGNHPIYRILSHTMKDNELDWLLIKYMCMHSKQAIPSDRNALEFEDREEISWQPASNIDPELPILKKYLKSKGNEADFKKYLRKYGQGARHTKGRKVYESVMPNLGKNLQSGYGPTCAHLNEKLSNWDGDGFDSKSGEFDSLRDTVVFFNGFAKECNRINNDDSIRIFPNIVGKLAHVTRVYSKLNHLLKTNDLSMFVSPVTACQKIRHMFYSKSGQKVKIVVALLFHFNSRISSVLPNKHCSVGIFEKTAKTGFNYYYFEPTMQDYTYWRISKTMSDIVSNMRSATLRQQDVFRAFETQTLERNCYIRCIRYISLLNDGFYFKTIQNFVLDQELRTKWEKFVADMESKSKRKRIDLKEY